MQRTAKQWREAIKPEDWGLLVEALLWDMEELEALLDWSGKIATAALTEADHLETRLYFAEGLCEVKERDRAHCEQVLRTIQQLTKGF